MIEGKFEDFTELDNDYITVWSKFCAGEDFDQCLKEMESLAEMGNVNAICAYYLLNPKGFSNVIVSEQMKRVFKNHVFTGDLYNFYYTFTLANHHLANNNIFLTYENEKVSVDILQDLVKKEPENLLLRQKLYGVMSCAQSHCKKDPCQLNWEEILKTNNDLLTAIKKHPNDPRYLYFFSMNLNLFIEYKKENLLLEGSCEKRDVILKYLGQRPLSRTLQNYMRNFELPEKERTK